jgi:hypothetical protein
MKNVTNSTNLVKELFPKIDPTRFHRDNEIQAKQESIYILRSSKNQGMKRST